MSISKTIFSLFMLLFIFSCGINNLGKDNKSTDFEETEDRRFLLNIYNSITGTYKGFVIHDSTGETYPIEIYLYVLEYENGLNKNGEPIFLPKLRARYKRVDYIGDYDDQILSVKYIRESGEIILASSEINIPIRARISIRGYLLNSKFDANLTKGYGVIGRLTAQKVSVSANSTIINYETEEREILKKVLKPLEGIYVGEVTNSVIVGQDGVDEFINYKVIIKLFLAEEQNGLNHNGEPKFIPVLRSRFKRVDAVSNVFDHFLAVRYFYETKQIIMGNTLGNPMGFAGKYFFSINGTIIDEIIEGDVATHLGSSGRIFARKISTIEEKDASGL